MQLVNEIAGGQQVQSFHILINEIPDEWIRESILKQIAKLQQLMEELQLRNNINEQLLKDALSFTQQMINQVTKSQTNHFNYQSPGSQQQRETGSKGFFDTRA
ncbi:MAG: flagellar protein FlgN [Bacillus sp. (in: Bacteria)]|nr:flagellar protein FlgN [Bacillus sp. (in: firmicutes)]